MFAVVKGIYCVCFCLLSTRCSVVMSSSVHVITAVTLSIIRGMSEQPGSSHRVSGLYSLLMWYTVMSMNLHVLYGTQMFIYTLRFLKHIWASNGSQYKSGVQSTFICLCAFPFFARSINPEWKFRQLEIKKSVYLPALCRYQFWTHCSATCSKVVENCEMKLCKFHTLISLL